MQNNDQYILGDTAQGTSALILILVQLLGLSSYICSLLTHILLLHLPG